MTVIKQKHSATITRGTTRGRVTFSQNNGGVSVNLCGPRGGNEVAHWIDEDDFIEAAAYIAAKIKISRRKDND